MKKSVLSLSSSIILLFFFTSSAHAVDFGVGFISYFAWWQPGFRAVYQDMKVEPGFMVGPVLNISFLERWSVGAVALFSAYKMRASYNTHGYETAHGEWRAESEKTINRMDLDLSLSYKLNSIFTLFTGFKYYDLGDPADGREYKATYGSGIATSGDGCRGSFSFSGYGTGLGVGATFPIIENLSLTGTVSLVYYFAGDFVVNKITGPRDPALADGQFNQLEESGDLQSIGVNTTLSMAYCFPSINLIITLGGRFQYQNYELIQKPGIDMENDYYYGLILSAVYIF